MVEPPATVEWVSALLLRLSSLKPWSVKPVKKSDCTVTVYGSHVKRLLISDDGFGAAGASHDNQRTPNAHISGFRRFKNTTKIPREDTQREGRKKENCGGRGKKKREILGSPPFGTPPLRPPALWAPRPSGPHPSGHHFSRFGTPPYGVVPHPSLSSAVDYGQFRLRPSFFFSSSANFNFGQFLDVEFLVQERDEKKKSKNTKIGKETVGVRQSERSVFV